MKSQTESSYQVYTWSFAVVDWWASQSHAKVNDSYKVTNSLRQTLVKKKTTLSHSAGGNVADWLFACELNFMASETVAHRDHPQLSCQLGNLCCAQDSTGYNASESCHSVPFRSSSSPCIKFINTQ